MKIATSFEPSQNLMLSFLPYFYQNLHAKLYLFNTLKNVLKTFTHLELLLNFC